MAIFPIDLKQKGTNNGRLIQCANKQKNIWVTNFFDVQFYLAVCVFLLSLFRLLLTFPLFYFFCQRHRTNFHSLFRFYTIFSLYSCAHTDSVISFVIICHFRNTMTINTSISVEQHKSWTKQQIQRRCRMLQTKHYHRECIFFAKSFSIAT